MFIVVEGLDFAGKSSFVKALSERIRNAGLEVVATEEMGGTNFSLRLKELLIYPRRLCDQTLTEKTKLLGINTCRMENYDKVILPALAENKIVLCDRHIWSTVVYAPEELETFTWNLHRQLHGSLRPNFTFLLDIDYNTFIERRARALDLDEIEDGLYKHFDHMRTRYLNLADKERQSMILPCSDTLEERVERAFNRIIRRLKDDHRRITRSKAGDV